MDTAQSLTFRRLLTEAFKKGASDLHFTVGSRPTVRIHGSLQALESEEFSTEISVRDIVTTLLAADEQKKFSEQRDYIITRVFDERIRCKVHFFHQEGLPAISFRFLSMAPKALKDLNVPPQLGHFVTVKEGLLIVTGGYGSGRTTLATGILEEINRSRVEHIMTIERPIEYNLVGNKSIVNQREVGSDVVDFDTALHYVQEEDVDVLLVSDMPTLDSIRRVLELAGAGIYVITIMNADSVPRALEKISTLFEEHHQQHIRGLLADVLVGVVAQALLPGIGGSVIPVQEVLLNNESVKSMIVSGRLGQLDQLIKSSRAGGMMSFDHELATLVRNSRVSKDTALQSAHDRATLESLLR
ncbi:Flp pilus assembly complex ATPase component TadA [Candidatus Uhrbacteria bacterium]|nr:Flp pilus assembly complex ATPase component TadA [Candidatus Uhrbacteria bacterium]